MNSTDLNSNLPVIENIDMELLPDIERINRDLPTPQSARLAHRK